MTILKTLSVFSCYLFFTPPLRAAPMLRILNQTNVRALDASIAEQDVWRSVGLVLYGNDEFAPKQQTGFFVKPHLFVTAISPEDNGNDFNCHRIKIFSNAFAFKVRSLQEPSGFFRCIKMDVSPKLGIVVITTDKFSSDYIPVFEEKLVFGKTTKFSSIGYSAEAQLFYADGCRADGTPCKYCMGKPIIEEAWTDGSCLVRRGMQGAPLLFKDSKANNRWKVAGMVSTVMAGSPTELNSEVVGIVKLKDLITFDP